LSAHARRQLEDRTSLTESAFIQLIENDVGVPIGKEKGTYKAHILLYCNIEKLWFIAVIDEKACEVITILPPDYHNRWKVSTEAMLLAEKKAQMFEPVTHTPQTVPLKLIINCTVSNKSHTWIRTFGFGLPYEEYADCKEDISNQRTNAKINAVITQTLSKKYAPEVICQIVIIKFGRSGIEYKYPYEPALP
jgi:hypothetical protein